MALDLVKKLFKYIDKTSKMIFNKLKGEIMCIIKKTIIIIFPIFFTSCLLAHPRFIGAIFSNYREIKRFTFYETSCDIKIINDIIDIEQSINAGPVKFHFGFFTVYEDINKPYYLELQITKLTYSVSKIRINSINLLIDDQSYDVLNGRYNIMTDKYFNYHDADYLKQEEKITETYLKDRELFFSGDTPSDNIEYFRLFHELKFNYKINDVLKIVYDIDVELINGEKYNLKEAAIYNKKYIEER